jgi:hypothetical protein
MWNGPAQISPFNMFALGATISMSKQTDNHLTAMIVESTRLKSYTQGYFPGLYGKSQTRHISDKTVSNSDCNHESICMYRSKMRSNTRQPKTNLYLFTKQFQGHIVVLGKDSVDD